LLKTAYLVIVGKFTRYASKIIHIVQTENKVVLLTDASEKTKIDALSSSNLLVLPSINESFGGVFLEAWSAGKPVIGCETPVIKCVVDNMVDGLLLTSLDKHELAEKIIYLLKNEDEARRMGRSGKEKVLRDYTWRTIAEKTLKVYKVFSE
jgi:glycosyltransferase involved in cell wall biosynthesis